MVYLWESMEERGVVVCAGELSTPVCRLPVFTDVDRGGQFTQGATARLWALIGLRCGPLICIGFFGVHWGILWYQCLICDHYNHGDQVISEQCKNTLWQMYASNLLVPSQILVFL